jgi:hypothetical protein
MCRVPATGEECRVRPAPAPGPPANNGEALAVRNLGLPVA